MRNQWSRHGDGQLRGLMSRRCSADTHPHPYNTAGAASDRLQGLQCVWVWRTRSRCGTGGAGGAAGDAIAKGVSWALARAHAGGPCTQHGSTQAAGEGAAARWVGGASRRAVLAHWRLGSNTAHQWVKGRHPMCTFVLGNLRAVDVHKTQPYIRFQPRSPPHRWCQ
jgi:hypothetical protein